MEKDNQIQEKGENPKINRKEAIQRVGKYAAYTAASIMLLMSPVSSVAQTKSVTAHSLRKPKKHTP
jgi:hypothetical protein